MKIIAENNSWIAIGLVFLMAFSTDAWAARGRVQVSGNTVKSDKGTLLRGCRVSLDIWDETPSQADVNTMKNRGLNTIHVYAEYAGSVQAGGYNSAKVDNVVNLADSSGLYVILTIGSGGANGSFNGTFVSQFWNFYAPRYKDRTHVVYEIMNEPQAWSAPYNSTTLSMEKNTFNLIRGLAPNTHVMLMTYADPINPTQAANECANLGISWANASVAFHGYGIDGNENNALTAWFSAFKSKGIACGACTEPNLSNGKANATTTQIFENNGVSYTHFINVHSIATDNSVYYDVINNAGIHWTPDYGTWPSSGGGGGGTGVTFYQDYNYGGSASSTLGAGSYTMSQLAAAGCPNDWASSVRVSSGYSVTIYQNDNLSGTSWTLTSDTPNFGNLSPSANDQMSSCKVQ